MKLFFACILCLVLQAQTFAQDEVEPVVDILATTSLSEMVVKIPAEVEIGELVRMDASENDVEGITWRIIPETPDFVIVDNGRRAFFSSRSGGEFLVIVAGARDGLAFLYVQTLTVTGSPVPSSGLALKFSQWIKKAPNADLTKLPGMAGVFRNLATGNTPIEEMLDATALANSAVIGDSVDGLAPFLDALGKELDRLDKAGALETREDYQSVWLEIAAALDFIARKVK